MYFNDAIEEFIEWRKFKLGKSTLRGNSKDLKTLCVFLHNPELHNITLQTIMNYLNLMVEAGRTLRHERRLDHLQAHKGMRMI